jgi:hypothetical protein
MTMTEASVRRCVLSRSARWCPFRRSLKAAQLEEVVECINGGLAEEDLERDARNSEQHPRHRHGGVFQQDPHGEDHHTKCRKGVEAGERWREERAGGAAQYEKTERDVAEAVIEEKS